MADDNKLPPVIITGDDQSKPAWDSLRDNARGAKDDIKGFGEESKNTAQKTKSAFDSIKPAALGVTAAVTALVVGAAAAFKTVKDQLRALGDRSDDLRISPQFLAGLEVGAAKAGLPVDKLNSALDTFTANSKRTSDDAKGVHKSLTQVGEGFATAYKSAATQEDRLLAVARAYASTSDEVKKAQILTNHFGTDNERLGVILTQLAGNANAFINQARALGIEIDASMVKKAQEGERNIATLSTVLRQQFMVTLSELIPAAKEFAPVLERIAGSARDFFANFAAPANRPSQTLRNELNDLRAINDDLLGQRDKLKAEPVFGGLMADPGGYFTKRARHEIEADIASIDQKIANNTKTIQKYEDILEGRGEDQRARARGAASGLPPAFKPREDLGKDDPLERTMVSVGKHIALMKADAQAVGATAGEHERLRVSAQLYDAAEQKGIAVTAERAAKFRTLAERAREAADALAAARVQDNLFFERAQLGRSEIERKVAQELRSAGIDLQSAKGQWLSDQIRVNATLSETKDLSKDALKPLLDDALKGQFRMESLAGAIDRVKSKLADKVLDVGLSALFKVGIGSLGGGASVADATFGGFSAAGSSVAAVKMHGGGEVGRDGVPMRVPSALFANARRMHGGGPVLRQDEVPIIGQVGEKVMPRGTSQRGGGYVDQRNFTFDARGADPAALARLERLIMMVKTSSKSDAIAALQDYQDRFQ
jgi:hypothetical protein